MGSGYSGHAALVASQEKVSLDLVNASTGLKNPVTPATTAQQKHLKATVSVTMSNQAKAHVHVSDPNAPTHDEQTSDVIDPCVVFGDCIIPTSFIAGLSSTAHHDSPQRKAKDKKDKKKAAEDKELEEAAEMALGDVVRAAGPTSIQPSQKINVNGYALDLHAMFDSETKALKDLSLESLALPRIPYRVPRSYEVAPFGGGMPARVKCLSLPLDNARVVGSANAQDYAKVLSMEGVELLHLQGHADVITCLAHSPDGRYLLTGTADCCIMLFDATTGKRSKRIAGHFPINCCSFTCDGDRFVIGTGDDQTNCITYDSKSGDRLLSYERHEEPVLAVAWSPESSVVASGGLNAVVHIWHADDGSLQKEFQHKRPGEPSGNFTTVSFSSGGTRLLTVCVVRVRMWDLYGGNELWCKAGTSAPLLRCIQPSLERSLLGRSTNETADGTKVFVSQSSFVGGDLVMVSLTTRQCLILEPNTGQEVLSISVRGTCTACAANDTTAILGDNLGNMYKVKWSF